MRELFIWTLYNKKMEKKFVQEESPMESQRKEVQNFSLMKNQKIYTEEKKTGLQWSNITQENY